MCGMFDIFLTVPPVLNCLPTTVYGNIGDTATVSCNVSANPDCRYLELSWGNVGTEKVVTAATSNVASPGIRLSSHVSFVTQEIDMDEDRNKTMH